MDETHDWDEVLAMRAVTSLFGLIEAKRALDRAWQSVPAYTGQHSPEDFVAAEQAAYVAAVAAYVRTHKSLRCSPTDEMQDD